MSTSILSTLAPSVTGINYLPLSRLSRNSGEALQVCLPSSCDPTMRLNNMYIVLTGDLGHFICLSGIAVLYFLFLSFSIYCLALAFEHYRQVYIVHSGMQDESLQVTISKLPQGSLTCTGGDFPCTGDIQLTSRSEGRCTYLASSLQMTLEKVCSVTEIFSPRAGIEPGTSSTRGKCLTTELPRFRIQGNLQSEITTLTVEEEKDLYHVLFFHAKLL